MADTFFEFRSSLPGGLDENLADDAVGHSLDGEEEEYDALNDETFGGEDTNDDWEQDHEKLAEFTEQSRSQRESLDSSVIENGDGDGLDLEKSLSRLVLDEYDDPETSTPRQTRPPSSQSLQSLQSLHSRLGGYTSTPPGHSVWGVNKNDVGLPAISTPLSSRTPIPGSKSVCTVEELERDLLTFRSPSVGRGIISPNEPARPVAQMPPAGNFRQMLDHHAKQRARMEGEPSPGLPLSTDIETHVMNMQNHRHMGGPQMMIQKLGGFRPFMNRMDSNMGPPPNVPGGFPLRGFVRKPPHSGRPIPHPDQQLGLPVVLGNNGPFSSNGIRHHPIFNRPIMPSPMGPPMMGRPNDGPQFGVPRVPPYLAPHHLAHNSQRIPMPGGAGMNHHLYHKGHNNSNFHHQHHHHQQMLNPHQYPSLHHHDDDDDHHHRDRVRNSINGAGDYDEYAGLMTNWQKQWLLNIQNLQLNVGPPYIADYYYTVYQHKKQKQKESQKAAPPGYTRKHPFDRRERSDSLKSSNRERPSSVLGMSKVYTPLQFENSLGKLQCGSVTAPRKLIDMEVMSPEVNDGTQATQRDTRKTKQLLLEIESMYLLLLKLEDALNPMAQAAAAELLASKREKRAMAAVAREEERRQDSDAGEDDEDADEERDEEPPSAEELLERLSSMLLQGDKLLSVLSIRKGKTLLLRLLPHVSPDAPLLSALFSQLLSGLALLARRDAGTEPLLPRFVPFFQRWVATCGLPQTLRLTTAVVTDPRSTPVPGRKALPVALANKFGSSALSMMMTLAAEKLTLMDKEQSAVWGNFMEALVAAADAARIPDNGSSRPVEPLDAAVLQMLLSRVKATEQQAALLKQALCFSEDTLSMSSRPSTATPPVS